jgi:hypothetical protein
MYRNSPVPGAGEVVTAGGDVPRPTLWTIWKLWLTATLLHHGNAGMDDDTIEMARPLTKRNRT